MQTDVDSGKMVVRKQPGPYLNCKYKQIICTRFTIFIEMAGCIYEDEI